MPMVIAGIGTALPRYQIDQADAADIVRKYSCDTEAQGRLFQRFYDHSGVAARYSVLLDRPDGSLEERQSFYGTTSPTTRERMQRYEREASELAITAASGALENSGVAAGSITHVISVTCSGFFSPGIDITLIRRLGLPAGVARTQVGFMGCHGALNGLRVAQAFVQADPDACVLLCAVELCSLHHQYGWNVEQIVANALFADGAGAVVCVGSERRTESKERSYQFIGSGSTVIDDSEDAMSWRIGDHGFLMTLSRRVPELIGQHLRPWLEGRLAENGLTIDTVGSWAVHPGGPRILSAVGEALGLDRSLVDVSHRVLAECGNMSSPTVLFILDRLMRSGAARPCVSLAFGPGLAVEAAILE
jgi:predicted naringenin-chalcone synthase